MEALKAYSMILIQIPRMIVFSIMFMAICLLILGCNNIFSRLLMLLGLMLGWHRKSSGHKFSCMAIWPRTEVDVALDIGPDSSYMLMPIVMYND